MIDKEAIRARANAAKEGRFHWTLQYAADVSSLLDALEAAERRAEELAEWLERNSQHPHGCPARSVDPTVCTCGLAALLDRIAAPLGGGEGGES